MSIVDGINVRRLEQALKGCGYFQDDDAETAAPSVAKLYDESRAFDIRRLHYDPIYHLFDRPDGRVAGNGQLLPFKDCGNEMCVWARGILAKSNGWAGLDVS